MTLDEVVACSTCVLATECTGCSSDPGFGLLADGMGFGGSSLSSSVSPVKLPSCKSSACFHPQNHKDIGFIQISNGFHFADFADFIE